MLRYYIDHGRIRCGTPKCKGVREAKVVYKQFQQAQDALDAAELESFYNKLSAGGKLSRRALCHIKALQSELSDVKRQNALLLKVNQE